MNRVVPLLLIVSQLYRGGKRRIRNWQYGLLLNSMGRGCQICSGVMIAGPEFVSLGERVILNEGVIIQSCEGASIVIGDNVTISYRAMVLTGRYSRNVYQLGASGKAFPVTIEPGSWIGAGAVILPGVTIGRGTVVAAGSIVSRSLPGDVLVAGQPAKPIRRLSKEHIPKLRAL